MAAIPSGNMRITSEMQDKLDELKAMFPELPLDDLRLLLEQYNGDIMQIIDKLLQQPSPPPSEPVIERDSNRFSASSASAFPARDISVSAQPNTMYSSTAGFEANQSAQNRSPWGPIDGAPARNSFPSAFALPSGSPPAKLSFMSSATSSTGSSSPADRAPGISIPVTRPDIHNPQPIGSISPPKQLNLAAAVNTVAYPLPSSTLDHHVPIHVLTGGSSHNPSVTSAIPAHLLSTPSQHAPTFHSPVSGFSALPHASEPSLPATHTTSSTKNSYPSLVASYSAAPPEQHHVSPSTTLYSASTHEAPRPPSSPFSTSNNGRVTPVSPVHTTSTGQLLPPNTSASPLGFSMTSSRTSEERSARLRAAELQFQSLMASMSELEATNMKEMEVKDTRIETLLQENAHLQTEKSALISRSQTMSQTVLQLRDENAAKNAEIELLKAQLLKANQENQALRSKVASFQPIEAAEQLRSAFESSISASIASQGNDPSREALDKFVATFQQAFASALLASKP